MEGRDRKPWCFRMRLLDRPGRNAGPAAQRPKRRGGLADDYDALADAGDQTSTHLAPPLQAAGGAVIVDTSDMTEAE